MWKDLPLRLLHHSSLQNLRCIAFFYFNSLLENDRTGIRSFVYKMYGCSNHLYPSGKCCLMNLQSIISRSAERRNQRWMDIDDLISVSADHFFRNHNQKSRQNDQIRFQFVYLFKKNFVKLFSCLKILRRNALCRDLMIPGSCECICVLIIADDTDQLCIGDRAIFHCINDCLQIGSASGYKYSNS